MSKLTKNAIKNSLIKLLNERPYNQITVKDIVDDCGINRNTFYYHFEDIPSLLQEIVTEETDKIMNEYLKIDTIDECIEVIFQFALKNKKAVLHIYKSTNRDIYEQYFFKVCEHVVIEYVDTLIDGKSISVKDRDLLIRMYKCSFFGMMTEWLNNGMNDELIDDIRRICEFRQGLDGMFIERLASSDK